MMKVHNCIYACIPDLVFTTNSKVIGPVIWSGKNQHHSLRDCPSYTIISILDIGKWELSLGKVEEWQDPTVKSQISALCENDSHCGILSPRHWSTLTSFRSSEIISVGTNGLISVLGASDQSWMKEAAAACSKFVQRSLACFLSPWSLGLLKRWFSFFWVTP